MIRTRFTDLLDAPAADKTMSEASLAVSFADYEDMVWIALVNALGNSYYRLNRENTLKVSRFSKENWNHVVYYMKDLVETNGGKTLPRAGKIALMSVMFSCLVTQIHENRSKKPANVLRDIENLQWAIEESYPGYLEAGLLARVIAPATRRPKE